MVAVAVVEVKSEPRYSTQETSVPLADNELDNHSQNLSTRKLATTVLICV
jgi:hypothetical protein